MATFRNYSFESLVAEHDPNHYKHDEEVYEFSDGRVFRIDDHTSGGIYSGSTWQGAEAHWQGDSTVW